jgi:hypothetical protein
MGTMSGCDGDELFDGTDGGYITAIHGVRVKEVVVDGENGVGIAVGAGFVCSRLEDEDSGRHGNARISDESRSAGESAGAAARCGLGCARLRGRVVCGGCCADSAARGRVVCGGSSARDRLRDAGSAARGCGGGSSAGARLRGLGCAMRARLRAAAGAARLRGLLRGRVGCGSSSARARLRGLLRGLGCAWAVRGRMRAARERLRAAGRLRVGGVVCALGVCAGMEMDGGDLVDVNGRLGYRWGHGCAWSTLPS